MDNHSYSAANDRERVNSLEFSEAGILRLPVGVQMWKEVESYSCALWFSGSVELFRVQLFVPLSNGIPV